MGASCTDILLLASLMQFLSLCLQKHIFNYCHRHPHQHSLPLLLPLHITLPLEAILLRGYLRVIHHFIFSSPVGLPRSSVDTARNLCRYCKKPGHMVLTCKARKSIHGPFVPRSSVAASATVRTHVPQRSVGSLFSNQLSQIASYLAQNLGTSGMPSSSDATTMSAAVGNSTHWIFNSNALVI